jgi:predicted ATPase/class 3 adenylate cyclase
VQVSEFTNCSRCNQQNRPEAQFCSECGAKLEPVCPACGAQLLVDAKFCDHCGIRLTPVEAPEGTRGSFIAQDSAEASRLEGERRQLTVMFCDLVDSTALSERLDPEDLQAILNEYRAVCAAVIRRFEGNIAQFLGDGLLVYFGYPRAHEDDAQRAARAGLGMIEAITELNPKLRRNLGIELAVRIGIHTGLVVVGQTGKEREAIAVGDTPNIAARLQTIAKPGTVLATISTYRLLHGLFDCEALGDQTLKGLSQPLKVYEVRHESTARSRRESLVNTELSPLVGRKAEMEFLIDRWAQVKEGIGHVVFLSGEAGIGKSRLLEALKEHISQDPQSWLTPCRCSPFYQNTPFYPIVDFLGRVVLGFGKEDSQAARLDKLEGFIVQYGLPTGETVPLFASLLSLPLLERFAPLKLTPQAQKQKTIHALNTILLRRAAKQPLLFLMEDLHWVDPSTLELLTLLVDQGPATKALIVLTFRTDFKSPWSGRSHVSQLTLNRVTQNQVVDIVTHIAHGKTMPPEVLQQIVIKTDGVPLFIEELTKMVLESGLLREEEHSYRLTESLPPLAIPATLQDSLRARLDRLSTVSEVVQLAATLGREFTYELLKSVSSLAEQFLLRELSRLVEAEFLYQRGTPPQATFIFKHALIQDAAYQSLLKSSRQRFHAKIGDTIEERFPEIVETQPELLAYHFTEALQAKKAVKYWEKAGRRDLERSAYLEAIAHLRKGIEVVRTLPPSAERTQWELGLQVALGNALLAVKGYAALEVEQTYAQAHALCQEIGLTAQAFPVLYGLWVFYFIRAELAKAREIGGEFLELARKQEETAPVLMAHRVIQFALLWMGEISLSQTHFEQCTALYNAEQHRSLAFQYGQDPGMATLSLAPWSLWLLGYPDQALQRSQEALLAAQRMSHPLSLAYAHVMAAGFHQLRREERLVREKAEAAIAICSQHGFPYWLAWGNILRGWALAQQGETNEGIAQIRQGMADYRATGSMLEWTGFCALLAEAHFKAGQIKEGLNALDEGFTVMEKTGERFYQAELYRLKGELLLQSNNYLSGAGVPKEVQEYFDKALQIASRQSAKSLNCGLR